MTQMFIDALDVDDVIAHLLVTEGFSSVEDVAYVALDDLTDIEGFDEEIAAELQNRAKTYLEKKLIADEAARKEMGVADELAEIAGLTSSMLVALGEKGVKTLDDFADLASDELIEIVGDKALSEEQANNMIMKAREHWFADEETATV